MQRYSSLAGDTAAGLTSAWGNGGSGRYTFDCLLWQSLEREILIIITIILENNQKVDEVSGDQVLYIYTLLIQH